MKTKILLQLIILASFFSSCSNAQNSKEPWTDKQMMPPAQLADVLKSPSENVPIIFNIGPAGGIKNSKKIGDGKDNTVIEKLRKELQELPKDTAIVIYCGCCPFKNCPNVRPVFKLLNEMNFTNHYLLNTPQNLKVDWIDKRYPMSE